MSTTREAGDRGEAMAAEYLRENGYEILASQFRCRFGEIDLIARDGAYLVFIEVKYRSSLKDGDSLEAVNRRKQRKIIRVAEYYLCMHQEKADLPCRFDVIGIEEERIRLIDAHTSGFIYMVSSAATTGAQQDFNEQKQAYFRRINAMNLQNPRLVGFGISNKATFEAATAHSSGAIIGSKFVQLLKSEATPAKAVDKLLEALKQ